MLTIVLRRMRPSINNAVDLAGWEMQFLVPTLFFGRLVSSSLDQSVGSMTISRACFCVRATAVARLEILVALGFLRERVSSKSCRISGEILSFPRVSEAEASLLYSLPWG